MILKILVIFILGCDTTMRSSLPDVPAMVPNILESDCVVTQKTFSDITIKEDRLQSQSTSSFLYCAINGPHNEKIDDLVGSYKSLLADLTDIKSFGKDECFNTKANLRSFLVTLADQTGKMFGIAFVACSEDAQHILHDPKLSQRKINKQIEKLYKEAIGNQSDH